MDEIAPSSRVVASIGFQHAMSWRIKMDVKIKHMTLAYVLELRGCNIEPRSVKFVSAK